MLIYQRLFWLIFCRQEDLQLINNKNINKYFINKNSPSWPGKRVWYNEKRGKGKTGSAGSVIKKQEEKMADFQILSVANGAEVVFAEADRFKTNEISIE